MLDSLPAQGASLGVILGEGLQGLGQEVPGDGGAPTAVGVDRRVAGDLEEPGREHLRLAAISGQGVERPQEDLLHEIGRILRVIGPRAQIGVDTVAVSLVQRAKGARIDPRGLDLRGLVVHAVASVRHPPRRAHQTHPLSTRVWPLIEA